MTRLHRFSALKAIALSAALSMTAGLAIADSKNVSSDQILNALQPKQLTRGMSAGPQADPAVKAREISFINKLRNRKTRSLSLGEREEILAIASDKPKIDLDIQFDYNSDKITTTSMPSVQALGKALSDANLKGSTFVVAGHTDAIGSEAYNQDLSERRADTIKRYLTEKYGIMAPISSPLAMARPSRRIRTRRWTRSTAAFRSSTWIPRPRRSDACKSKSPPAAPRRADFARALSASQSKLPFIFGCDNRDSVPRQSGAAGITTCCHPDVTLTLHSISRLWQYRIRIQGGGPARRN